MKVSKKNKKEHKGINTTVTFLRSSPHSTIISSLSFNKETN